MKKLFTLIVCVVIGFATYAGSFKGVHTDNVDGSTAIDCLTDQQTIDYLDHYLGIVADEDGNYDYEIEYQYIDIMGSQIPIRSTYIAPDGVAAGEVIFVEVNDYWKGEKISSTEGSVGESSVSSLFDQVKYGVKKITKVTKSAKSPSGTFFSVDATSNRFFFAQRKSSIKEEFHYLSFRWYEEWSSVNSTTGGWDELEPAYSFLQNGEPQPVPHNCDCSLEVNHYTILSEDKNAVGETESVTILCYIPDNINTSTSNDSYAVPYIFFYRAQLSGELQSASTDNQYNAHLTWQTSFDKSTTEYPVLKNTEYYEDGVGGIKEYYRVYRKIEGGEDFTLITPSEIEAQELDDVLSSINEGAGYDVTYYVEARVYYMDANGNKTALMAKAETNQVTLHVPGAEHFELKIEADYSAQYLITSVLGQSVNEFTNTVAGAENAAKSPVIMAGDVITLVRTIEGVETVVQTTTITGVADDGTISYTLTNSTGTTTGTVSSRAALIEVAAHYDDVFVAPAGTSQDATYQLWLTRADGVTKYFSNIVKVPTYKTVLSVTPVHRSGTPDAATCAVEELVRNDVKFEALPGGEIAYYMIYRNFTPVVRVSQPTDATGQNYVITLPDADGNFNVEGGVARISGDEVTISDYVNESPMYVNEPGSGAAKQYVYTVVIHMVDRISTYGNADKTADYKGAFSELVVNIAGVGYYGIDKVAGILRTDLSWANIKSDIDDTAEVLEYHLYKNDHQGVDSEYTLLQVFDGSTTQYTDYYDAIQTAGVDDVELKALPRTYYIKAIFSEDETLPLNRREKNSNIVKIESAMPTSVESIQDVSAEVSIFPNPASEYVTVKSADGIGEVAIYSTLGAEVRRADAQGDNTLHIDVSELPAGTYVVKVQGNAPQKLLIK